ncbi:MAG: prepilin-type N-terminal cleavage/methylation domain-containing protein [Burkholderiaceae bacterium]
MTTGARPAARPRRAAGFTLVEVLVALFILALLAAMAFRGVDALVHAKEGALASTDRTLQLNTGMAQFDYDVSHIVDSKVLPTPIMFDGATLRIARRAPDGIQLVLWTLQDRRWQRWAGPPVTHMSELTDQWLRSQQWDAISGNAVTVLRQADDFQVYLYNNGWSNVQSTQGAQPAAPAASGASAPGPGAAAVAGTVPTGIRIVVKVPAGEITREKELPHW